MAMEPGMKDKRPEPIIADLQREAKRAKSELTRAAQVPVPDDAEEQPADECQEANASDFVGEEMPPTQAIQGRWKSGKGSCSIFEDSMTNRLTYEEPLDDSRLHGWLEWREDELQEGAIACWVAVLHLLGEDELPWYGPSFGPEPEALGEIRVELLPGRKMQTSIWIEEEDEDWQSPTSFTRRPDGELEEAAAAAEQAAAGGAFVFGGGR
eukprot:TRINITY_DN25042_c0_g1_i1.p1 TRINITY_DN25042_c0_g1~~TRINITY_DN25042_c0_g1_i1.p1  ORF type:complete len:210 (-),score=58.02 TRINITY_DN25042_c0_g1_i1:31-660(-)